MNNLQLLVVRDPDGGVDIRAFHSGTEVTHDEVVVDTGAGYDWAAWCHHRDQEIARAATYSPLLEAAVRAAFDEPPGGRTYIGGKPDDEPWV